MMNEEQKFALKVHNDRDEVITIISDNQEELRLFKDALSRFLKISQGEMLMGVGGDDILAVFETGVKE